MRVFPSQIATLLLTSYFRGRFHTAYPDRPGALSIEQTFVSFGYFPCSQYQDLLSFRSPLENGNGLNIYNGLSPSDIRMIVQVFVVPLEMINSRLASPTFNNRSVVQIIVSPETFLSESRLQTFADLRFRYTSVPRESNPQRPRSTCKSDRPLVVPLHCDPYD